MLCVDCPVRHKCGGIYDFCYVKALESVSQKEKISARPTLADLLTPEEAGDAGYELCTFVRGGEECQLHRDIGNCQIVELCKALEQRAKEGKE